MRRSGAARAQTAAASSPDIPHPPRPATSPIPTRIVAPQRKQFPAPKSSADNGAAPAVADIDDVALAAAGPGLSGRRLVVRALDIRGRRASRVGLPSPIPAPLAIRGAAPAAPAQAEPRCAAPRLLARSREGPAEHDVPRVPCRLFGGTAAAAACAEGVQARAVRRVPGDLGHTYYQGAPEPVAVRLDKKWRHRVVALPAVLPDVPS